MSQEKGRGGACLRRKREGGAISRSIKYIPGGGGSGHLTWAGIREEGAPSQPEKDVLSLPVPSPGSKAQLWAQHHRQNHKPRAMFR